MGVRWKFGDEAAGVAGNIQAEIQRLENLINNVNNLAQENAVKVSDLENDRDDLQAKVQSLETFKTSAQNSITILEQFKATEAPYLTTLKTKIVWDDNTTRIVGSGGHWVGVRRGNAIKSIGYGDESLASEQWTNKQFAPKTTTANSITELNTFKTETNTYLTTLKTKIKWNNNTTYLQAPNNQTWLGIKNDAPFYSINNGPDQQIQSITFNANDLKNKVDENRDLINDAKGKITGLETFKNKIDRVITVANDFTSIWSPNKKTELALFNSDNAYIRNTEGNLSQFRIENGILKGRNKTDNSDKEIQLKP